METQVESFDAPAFSSARPLQYSAGTSDWLRASESKQPAPPPPPQLGAPLNNISVHPWTSGLTVPSEYSFDYRPEASSLLANVSGTVSAFSAHTTAVVTISNGAPMIDVGMDTEAVPATVIQEAFVETKSTGSTNRKRPRHPETWKRNNYQHKPLKDKGPCVGCARKCYSLINEARRGVIRQHFQSMPIKDRDPYLLSLITFKRRGPISPVPAGIGDYGGAMDLEPDGTIKPRPLHHILTAAAGTDLDRLEPIDEQSMAVYQMGTVSSSDDGGTDDNSQGDADGDDDGPHLLFRDKRPMIIAGAARYGAGSELIPVSATAASAVAPDAGRRINRSVRSKRYRCYYYLPSEDLKRKIHVCQHAFLNILGVGKKRLDSLVSYFLGHGQTPASDNRGKHRSRANKVPDELVELTRQYLLDVHVNERVSTSAQSSNKRRRPENSVVSSYREFLSRFQPAILILEKLAPHHSNIDKRTRSAKAMRAPLAPAAGDAPPEPLVQVLHKFKCVTCDRPSPDARGLFPCFYVPQESLPSKKDSPNMYLLGLFCSQPCVDTWVREVRFPAPSSEYNPVQCPLSGIKEIAPEYDLQSWVRPLVSRDKFERIFRELSAQWKMEKAEAASAARGGPAIAVAIDVSAGQATVE